MGQTTTRSTGSRKPTTSGIHSTFIYGYRRITLTINRQRGKEGLKKVNKKRIYRLMQICGLEAVIRHRSKRYRKVNPDYIVENILAREFTAEKPNQKWCTDINEFKYGNGKKHI